MTLVQGYTQTFLSPQLRSLGLSKRQREIVVEDVTQRLESLLFHWNDLPFRRTILVLGTEEASFWEPRTTDVFGSLPRRFPNAWHVLALLGNSTESEVRCDLPMAAAEPMELFPRGAAEPHTEIESGIDPGLNDFLADFLRKVESKEANL